LEPIELHLDPSLDDEIIGTERGGQEAPKCELSQAQIYIDVKHDKKFKCYDEGLI